MVGDAVCGKLRGQAGAVEVGVAFTRREAPHVGNEGDAVTLQYFQELPERPRAGAQGVDYGFPGVFGLAGQSPHLTLGRYA